MPVKVYLNEYFGTVVLKFEVNYFPNESALTKEIKERLPGYKIIGGRIDLLNDEFELVVKEVNNGFIFSEADGESQAR